MMQRGNSALNAAIIIMSITSITIRKDYQDKGTCIECFDDNIECDFFEVCVVKHDGLFSVAGSSGVKYTDGREVVYDACYAISEHPLACGIEFDTFDEAKEVAESIYNSL